MTLSAPRLLTGLVIAGIASCVGVVACGNSSTGFADLPPWCRPSLEGLTFTLAPSVASPGKTVSFDIAPADRDVAGSHGLLFGPADAPEPAFQLGFKRDGAPMTPWRRSELVEIASALSVRGTFKMVIPESARGRYLLCWEVSEHQQDEGERRRGFIVGEIDIDAGM